MGKTIKQFRYGKVRFSLLGIKKITDQELQEFIQDLYDDRNHCNKGWEHGVHDEILRLAQYEECRRLKIFYAKRNREWKAKVAPAMKLAKKILGKN